MFCPFCGMKIDDGKFCPYCGASLEEPSSEVIPAEEAPEIVQEIDAPEAGQEVYVPEAGQEIPVPYAEIPAAENEQPVRFDTSNVYAYNQTYDAENPYGGQPAADKDEKAQKNGKKLLLWILLGAAALLLVAGIVVLLFSLKNCGSSQASGSHLLIRTQKGGVYLDDEKGEVVRKADDVIYSSRFTAALAYVNNKWFFVKNGETRIGGSDASLLAVDRINLSWVLYADKNEDVFLFREGKEDIEVFEDARPAQTKSSQNGKYLALQFNTRKSYTIVLINGPAGEITTIYEAKDNVRLQFVDNDGCVYYTDEDEIGHVSDGKDDVELEDISGGVILEDTLLLMKENKRGSRYTFYSRPCGMKGEMTALDEKIDEDLLDQLYSGNAVRFITSPFYGYGYIAETVSGTSGYPKTNKLLVDYDRDLYILDVKAGTTELLMENVTVSEMNDFRLTEDMKTAYLRTGSTLYKLTAAKDGWEKERLSRHCTSVKDYRPGGLVYFEEDGAVFYDGKESVEITESFDAVDVSDDFKSYAYLDGGKVMYVRKAGEKAERLARDNDGRYILLFQNYVYYINEDGDLARVKPGKEPEVVLEDVISISRIRF
ncbi:MAG: zinc ribbon domain-containing protein [Lachnospiraceae bacterium]|nr:zinc ribbon domain-containing protein [Lachnospiraceae bacterium]